MLPGQALKAGPQPRSLSAGIGAQVVFHDLLKDGQSRGARNGVALEGMALDKAGIFSDRSPEGIANLLTADHRRQGSIATAETLADAQDIGRDPECLGCEHAAGAANTSNDLIEDQ